MNIHSEKQFGRYGIQFVNLGSPHDQDITFAYKLIRKDRAEVKEFESDADAESIINAAPLSEEARLFKVLEQANQEMGHFMTENKF